MVRVLKLEVSMALVVHMFGGLKRAPHLPPLVRSMCAIHKCILSLLAKLSCLQCMEYILVLHFSNIVLLAKV
jgi:hypothetical protein